LSTGDSARHEQPIARNKRLKQDDEDDAPTYVLEESNHALTKDEYDALVSGKDAKDSDKANVVRAGEERLAEGETKSKDKIVEVGSTAKKRKAAKVISDEQEASKKGEDDEDDAKAMKVKTVKKPKKRAKPVKLTFGEEEEG